VKFCRDRSMCSRGIYRRFSLVERKLGLREGKKRSTAREDAVQEEEFGERKAMTNGVRPSEGGGRRLRTGSARGRTGPWA
jgi:hypothetical protein